MIAFLADENISPESADYLEALGYPCYSLRREGPWRLSDSEIVHIARREGRIILAAENIGSLPAGSGIFGRIQTWKVQGHFQF